MAAVRLFRRNIHGYTWYSFRRITASAEPSMKGSVRHVPHMCCFWTMIRKRNRISWRRWLLPCADIRRHFPVRQRWSSFMTGTRWMMPEIITVPLAGLLPGEKARISAIMTESRRFFPPVRELRSTGRNLLTGSEILMRSILLIWKIWISAIVPGSAVIRTGMLQKRRFIM